MEKEKNYYLILDLAPTTKAVGSIGLSGEYLAPTTKAVGYIGLSGEYLAPTTKAVGSDFMKYFEPTTLVVGLQKTSYNKYF